MLHHLHDSYDSSSGGKPASPTSKVQVQLLTFLRADNYSCGVCVCVCVCVHWVIVWNELRAKTGRMRTINYSLTVLHPGYRSVALMRVCVLIEC